MSLRRGRYPTRRLFGGHGEGRKLSLEVLEDRRLLAGDFHLLKDVNAL
jgi:hypothetical protein